MVVISRQLIDRNGGNDLKRFITIYNGLYSIIENGFEPLIFCTKIT